MTKNRAGSTASSLSKGCLSFFREGFVNVVINAFVSR